MAKSNERSGRDQPSNVRRIAFTLKSYGLNDAGFLGSGWRPASSARLQSSDLWYSVRRLVLRFGLPQTTGQRVPICRWPVGKSEALSPGRPQPATYRPPEPAPLARRYLAMDHVNQYVDEQAAAERRSVGERRPRQLN